MSDNIDDLLFRATLCERAEKYEEMVKVTKDAIKFMSETKLDYQVKARNSFSIAYKNLAGSRRSSWRVLSTEYMKHDPNDNKSKIVVEYMKKVEEELIQICEDVIETIEKYIADSKSFSDPESKVFFLKMKGDYYRYKAEVSEDDNAKFNEISDLSQKNYNEARKIAEDLKDTNPVKLGLALNFSVYLYEIAKDSKNACQVAKEAFDQAIAGLDDLSEDHYKDSTLIMQLLRDNMTLWTNQEEQMREEEQRNVVEEEFEGREE